MSGKAENQTIPADELSGHFQSLQADSGIGAIPLRSLSRRPPLVLAPESSIKEALIALNRAGSEAGLVAPQADLPLGIVTLRNLVEALTLQGGSLEDPVIAFMTAAPLSLPADAPAHRAKVLMTRSRFHHLLLTEKDGTFYRLISQAEIPGYREGGAAELAGRINGARDLETVVLAAGEVRKRGAELFASGMGVEALCQWMSCLNDLISLQIIALVADGFDLPPVPWCWMVFGSEGRLEQTFSTDQDNGLIFQPKKEEEAETARQAFLPFAAAVNNALDRCGFSLCKGGIMAGNPQWCLSFREWQEKFREWLETPEPEAILNSTIFFDFRPLYGQEELVDRLRSWLLPQPPQRPRFLHCLGEQALTCAPALGFLGRFIHDGGREFPHTIDLKMHGVRPFVDAARIWGLQHQAWETNTADRLRAVAATMRRSATETAATVEAFELVQRLRMQQQLTSATPEKANRLEPRQLNRLQKLALRQALGQAKFLQQRLKQQFNL